MCVRQMFAVLKIGKNSKAIHFQVHMKRKVTVCIIWRLSTDKT